ncbi:hypothetical protein LG634_35460 [Streptomyces bambusae]|uniref:hypothetical protein n=1 Tax=Streptomyces bambusae TaxID=1550616 RepID=UPI001CFF78AE|nr:hypothetical protein [Streptomyces bambusae]MCB5170089.1 hypothetical protein [Streptomyces bambusae]
MTSGSADGSPASLFGPVSVFFGVVALITAALAGHTGIAFPLLAGSLAVTFGVIGLVTKLNRVKSTVGLVAGSLGVLYPVFLVAAVSG